MLLKCLSPLVASTFIFSHSKEGISVIARFHAAKQRIEVVFQLPYSGTDLFDVSSFISEPFAEIRRSL